MTVTSRTDCEWYHDPDYDMSGFKIEPEPVFCSECREEIQEDDIEYPWMDGVICEDCHDFVCVSCGDELSRRKGGKCDSCEEDELLSIRPIM